MSIVHSLQLTRGQRIAVLLGMYSVVLMAATWIAYGLRFDFVVPMDHASRFFDFWLWIWAGKLAVLAVAGQFSSLLSFFSLPDLKRLGVSLGSVTLVLMGLWYVSDGPVHSMSRGVIVLDGLLSFLGLSACRLLFRLVRQSTGSEGELAVRRVGIVGAGKVGAALARELQTSGRLKPVVFFDDADRKIGAHVHGVAVAGPVESMKKSSIPALDEVIIAMPKASGERVRAILEFLAAQGIPCRTIPSLGQLAEGEMVSSLRPVEIGDVLGRESVDLDAEGLQAFYGGKTVLVTGAGGSIGSELCRQLARHGASRLVLVERSESALFEINTELSEAVDCVPELTDVVDSNTLGAILREHRPAVVFHAAAFKHVGLLERQPEVALRNNVAGTHTLASLAREHEVDRVVLVSTDKAVAPSNVMGATKRVAERLFEGFALEPDATRFVSVRFGNVLGSSGSVVPIFQKQIAEGGPVTVRDPEVTRYFMSIPEAAGLVLCSAMIGENGDRFILDMGEPVRIMDLADQMIRLSGKTPGSEIEIKVTGLSPGEKLHELLHSPSESAEATSHVKIQRIRSECLSEETWEELQNQLKQLDKLQPKDAIGWLQRAVPDFRPD